MSHCCGSILKGSRLLEVALAWMGETSVMVSTTHTWPLFSVIAVHAEGGMRKGRNERKSAVGHVTWQRRFFCPLLPGTTSNTSPSFLHSPPPLAYAHSLQLFHLHPSLLLYLINRFCWSLLSPPESVFSRQPALHRSVQVRKTMRIHTNRLSRKTTNIINAS